MHGFAGLRFDVAGVPSLALRQSYDFSNDSEITPKNIKLTKTDNTQNVCLL